MYHDILSAATPKWLMPEWKKKLHESRAKYHKLLWPEENVREQAVMHVMRKKGNMRPINRLKQVTVLVLCCNIYINKWSHSSLTFMNWMHFSKWDHMIVKTEFTRFYLTWKIPNATISHFRSFQKFRCDICTQQHDKWKWEKMFILVASVGCPLKIELVN